MIDASRVMDAASVILILYDNKKNNNNALFHLVRAKLIDSISEFCTHNAYIL